MKALLALLAVATAAAVSAPALANDDAILKCRGLSDDKARLQCYDGISLGQAAAPAAMSATAPAAPTRRQLEHSFGMEAIQPVAKLDEIESTLVGRIDGWGPGHVFRLANGQAWRVVDGSEAVTREMTNPKVKVVRGALGAMYLEIDGTNNSPKVKRVE
jgi:hypothetical protein